MSETIEPRAYSIAQASGALGLCRDSIYKLIRSGALPAKKCGKRTLILVTDLDAYLQSMPSAYEVTAA